MAHWPVPDVSKAEARTIYSVNESGRDTQSAYPILAAGGLDWDARGSETNFERESGICHHDITCENLTAENVMSSKRTYRTPVATACIAFMEKSRVHRDQDPAVGAGALIWLFNKAVAQNQFAENPASRPKRLGRIGAGVWALPGGPHHRFLSLENPGACHRDSVFQF